MSKVAKPLQDDEAVEPLDDDGNPIEFVQKDADDNSTKEAKKAASGFTPTQPVSWPHSRAKPPQEPLSEEEVHGRTRGEHAKTNRVLDSREEAERARRDDHRHDPDGDRARGSIEARWAAGYTKIAGKHVVNPGLLTRDSGRLKVLPESISAEEREKWLGRAIELDEIAKKELHGRNATIFEGRVTDPLLGRGPRRSAKELATKFGIPEKRVYKIEDKCWERVEAAVRQHKRDDESQFAEWELKSKYVWTIVPPPGPRHIPQTSDWRVDCEGKIWVRDEVFYRVRKPKKE